MKIIRNGKINLEELRTTVDGKAYRVTGSPTVDADKYAMVEVYRPETMHGYRDRVRFAHWARVVSPKRREIVRQRALNSAGRLN